MYPLGTNRDVIIAEMAIKSKECARKDIASHSLYGCMGENNKRAS